MALARWEVGIRQRTDGRKMGDRWEEDGRQVKDGQEREDKQTLSTQETDVHTHMYCTVYRSICCNIYTHSHA